MIKCDDGFYYYDPTFLDVYDSFDIESLESDKHFMAQEEFFSLNHTAVGFPNTDFSSTQISNDEIMEAETTGVKVIVSLAILLYMYFIREKCKGLFFTNKKERWINSNTMSL